MRKRYPVNYFAFATSLLIVLAFCLYLISASDVEGNPEFGLSAWMYAVGLFYAVCFSWGVATSGLSVFTLAAFFFLSFVAVTPIIFYRTGAWLYGNINDYQESALWRAQFFSFVFWLVFCLSYFNFSKSNAIALRLLDSLKSRVVRGGWWVWGLVYQAAYFIFVISVFGKDALFARGAEIQSDVASPISLLVFACLRPLTYCFFALSLFEIRRKRIDFSTLFPVVLLGMGALACNFPTSLSRTYFFGYICTCFFPIMIGTRFWHLSSAFILIGGFFGGVITDRFRVMRNISDLSELFTPIDIRTYLYAGHFDAFEIFIYIVRYVDETGLAWGRQLLGVLFFWVPRSIWVDKPIATGQLMGSDFININQSTLNVNLACPLQAEAYIDFGLIGLLIAALFWGRLAGVIDTLIRACDMSIKLGRSSSLSYLLMFAGMFVGCFFLVLRGSLMSGFAYLVGGIVAATICLCLSTKRL